MLNKIATFFVFFAIYCSMFAAPGVLEEIELDARAQNSILGTLFPNAHIELFKKTYVAETIDETKQTNNKIVMAALWRDEYYIFIESFDRQKSKCYECQAVLGYAIFQHEKDMWVIKKPYVDLVSEGKNGRYKPHTSLALANKDTPAFVFTHDEQTLDRVVNKKLLIFFGDNNHNLQEVLNVQLNNTNSCQQDKIPCMKKYLTAHFIPSADNKLTYYSLLLSINTVENIAEEHKKKSSAVDILFKYNISKARYDIDQDSIKLAEAAGLILDQ